MVIYNSNLNKTNIKINFFDKTKVNNLENIFDEKLLTGCLTIIDTYIENISIKAENSNCEDAINFIRSNGSINVIEINNSFSDSVDLDFSNIIINKAILHRAANDCIDFSAGNYLINELIATKCLDKAVSVGEKSKVEINNLEVSQNKLDFAVKDSSSFYLKNINSDKKLDEICGSIYKKKQEFDGGKIFFNKNKFPCALNKDLYSEIILNAKK